VLRCISIGLAKGSNFLGCTTRPTISDIDRYLTAMFDRLSNEKPSAIFRLRGTFTPNTTTSSQLALASAAAMTDPANDVTAILGFAIEPLSEIHPQIYNLQSSSLTKPALDLVKDPGLLAERIAKHLFHYVSGFVGGGPVMPENAVPLAVIAKWYESFVGKVKAGGVGFLERAED
jgi:hypothetical protein